MQRTSLWRCSWAGLLPSPPLTIFPWAALSFSPLLVTFHSPRPWLLTKHHNHSSQFHPQVLLLVLAQATEAIHTVENFFARNPLLIHFFSPVNLFPPKISFHSPFKIWKLLQEFSFTPTVFRLYSNTTGENLPVSLQLLFIVTVSLCLPQKTLYILLSVSWLLPHIPYYTYNDVFHYTLDPTALCTANIDYYATKAFWSG